MQCNEIRKTHSNLIVIGKTTTNKEDFDNDDADNAEEFEGEEFEQETGWRSYASMPTYHMPKDLTISADAWTNSCSGIAYCSMSSSLLLFMLK